MGYGLCTHNIYIISNILDRNAQDYTLYFY
jgi:hypothetical protein